MNPRNTALVLIALLAGLALGYLLRPAPAPTFATPASSERQVLYWYDPMHPDQHFDRPGPSPFMDMDLVPKYADAGATIGTGVSIDARTLQNLGVRTARVERGTLAAPLRVAGTVAFDASASAVVQARTRGWLERVDARQPLMQVRRGQSLAVLVAPEWNAALAEYQALRRLGTPESADLRDAARQRLKVLGIPDASVRALERDGAAPNRINLPAPRDGVLVEVDARDGQAVEAGQPLFRINGLERVWIEAAVPEAQAAPLRIGLAAGIEVPAWPGRVFRGWIGAVLPEVDAITRTIRLRIELPNDDVALVPGMHARVQIDTDAGASGLLVPSEAVIRTGMRNVVLVEEAPGRFMPHEVRTGAEAQGRTVILAGLAEGDRVVVSGQFLIDSEASLRGSLRRLEAAVAPEQGHDHAAMPAAHDHEAGTTSDDAQPQGMPAEHADMDRAHLHPSAPPAPAAPAEPDAPPNHAAPAAHRHHGGHGGGAPA